MSATWRGLCAGCRCEVWEEAVGLAVGGEGHRAQAQFADVEAAATQATHGDGGRLRVAVGRHGDGRAEGEEEMWESREEEEETLRVSRVM